MILVVLGALGTNPKSLEKILEGFDIRGRIEAIETTTFLRSARILRKVLEENCCYSWLKKKKKKKDHPLILA